MHKSRNQAARIYQFQGYLTLSRFVTLSRRYGSTVILVCQCQYRSPVSTTEILGDGLATVPDQPRAVRSQYAQAAKKGKDIQRSLLVEFHLEMQNLSHGVGGKPCPRVESLPKIQWSRTL